MTYMTHGKNGDTMTTANDILAVICAGYDSAVTFYGGYAVNARGHRRLFEPAHVETERRNITGRVSFGRYRYRDGSAIEYRYHATRGASFKALP